MSMKKFVIFFVLTLLIGLSFFTGCKGTFKAKTAVVDLPDISKPNSAVVDLPDISKPNSVVVDGDQMFITEGPHIYIYSLTDFSLQRKIGSQGEGEGEFKITSFGGSRLFLDIQPDTLLVSSVGKLSFFKRNGDFIEEMKIRAGFLGNVFRKLGKRYVVKSSRSEQNQNYVTVNLYDGQLNFLKEVHSWENPFKPGKGTRTFNQPMQFHVGEGKIFCSRGKGITIDVYDSNGEKLYTIDHPFEKIKITEEHKKGVIHSYQTSPATAKVFKYIQPIIFPEYFPGIAIFRVEDKRLYVVTFKMQGDNEVEVLIFDLKGKLLNSVFLPFVKRTVLQRYPFTFDNGKLYQVAENKEKGACELHITDFSEL